jgi:hypothetical protein
MQATYGNGQTEQWSWMVTQLWTWIWSGMSWILDLQHLVFGYVLGGGSPALIALKAALLLLPAAVLIVSLWAMMVSLYTLPFRSGRGYFLTALLMSWWDVGRMAWFFWAGMGRFLFVLVGWVGSLIKAAARLTWNAIKGALNSPFAVLDWTSRRYFQPGVPWIAFLVLLLWSAVEATVFTFTLTPTLNEVFGGLTGFDPNPRVMTPLLYLFLFMLIAGSFACIQVLNDAIKARRVGEIIQMALVESAVMFFEVIFLYRELIDAITPWIAQQSGGEVQLGIFATLALASFGWVGVRGMSWFLFGRFGTPALLAILSRQTITQDSGVSSVPAPVSKDMWRAPVEALKNDVAWFQQEGRRLFELLTLPALQLLAAALNFAVVVVQSRPAFALPFKSLDELLASNPFANGTRMPRISGNLATPRDMPRVAS